MNHPCPAQAPGLAAAEAHLAAASAVDPDHCAVHDERIAIATIRGDDHAKFAALAAAAACPWSSAENRVGFWPAAEKRLQREGSWNATLHDVVAAAYADFAAKGQHAVLWDAGAARDAEAAAARHRARAAELRAGCGALAELRAKPGHDRAALGGLVDAACGALVAFHAAVEFADRARSELAATRDAGTHVAIHGEVVAVLEAAARVVAAEPEHAHGAPQLLGVRDEHAAALADLVARGRGGAAGGGGGDDDDDDVDVARGPAAAGDEL